MEEAALPTFIDSGLRPILMRVIMKYIKAEVKVKLSLSTP
jgi:hypothetical protein